ncbi:class I SAM-dependent rRNA methyltransferase [Athalassotoga saccharophila]|uniref:class I SAM-dependent rRNA methyltransferase n=1 Tax=Athalassotoga saccharophila TaxID=1441386 RepID=UPI00137AD7D4|nr:class I SAM-dependent rRNA methyltransferase [Athalassotoga saccharophila]BBJ27936.1 ribosomal RNA large subunit methyltransferase I [Athalassotoga saccharophila]
MIVIRLNKRGMEKISRKHLWIFSDEVTEIIADSESGIANLFYENHFVGRGLYNGRSKNIVKFLTSKDEEINEDFFKKRFNLALKRREGFSKFRREINSEGDLLPGLVVDRFGDLMVIQIRSLALEKMKDSIVKALVDLYSPSTVYERSDFESLPEEGLSREKGLLYGKIPQPVIVEENGLKFLVDIVKGQKTGFFYDQRDSRKFAREFARGTYALDLFTYTGGFALNLAKAGMSVDAVDLSEADLETGRQNAIMNGLEVNFLRGDAFNLKDLGSYDLIIADPPSLIKRKEDKQKAFDLLLKLTEEIFDHLKEGGRVSLCSCAYNIDRTMMEKVILNSSQKKNLIVRPLGWTGMPSDHPTLLSMPETDYLKCFWFETLRSDL